MRRIAQSNALANLLENILAHILVYILENILHYICVNRGGVSSESNCIWHAERRNRKDHGGV